MPTFNPHRHVRIWLTSNPEEFLNLENRLRFVKMRDINPNDEINFVFDRRLLNEKAFAELNEFCLKYSINPHDIQTAIIPNCSGTDEINLIKIYRDEVKNLANGGNLALCSDVLRWLKPVYTLGTYSDFDTNIDTRELDQQIEVQRNILLKAGSITLLRPGGIKSETLVVNNDIIAVVDPIAADPVIKKIQKNIYSAYTVKNNERNTPFSFYKAKFVADVKAAMGEVVGSFYLKSPQFTTHFKEMEDLAILNGRNKTSLQLRQDIIKSTKDNELYCAAQNIRASEVVAQNRFALKIGAGPLGYLMLSSKQRKMIKAMVNFTDEQIISKDRENLRMKMLKNIVMVTTGPIQIRLSLFSKLFYNSRQEFDVEVAPHSFEHYGLDKAFNSKQAIRLHASGGEYNQLANVDVGEVNDMYWLNEGKVAADERERKMTEATSTIQRFFRQEKLKSSARLPAELGKLQQTIADHLKQTKEKLDGIFGFFRDSAWTKEIVVLENMLTHFQTNRFNFNSFKEASKNYHLDDSCAMFGKSKTQEILERLTRLSRRATALSITDRDGMVDYSDRMSKKVR